MTKALFVGGSYIDSSGTTHNGSVDTYVTTDGKNWTKATNYGAPINTAWGTFGFIGGQFVAVGGYNGNATLMTEAFSTQDAGTTWKTSTISSSVNGTRVYDVTGIADGYSVTFKDTMYVLGGLSNSTYSGGFHSAQMRSSKDGFNWAYTGPIFMTSNSYYYGRGLATDTTLYWLGWLEGSGASFAINSNIRYSTDATTFTTKVAAWPARYSPAFGKVGNTFIVTGGYGDTGGTTKLADLWISIDGLNYTQQTYPSVFPSSGFADATVVNIGTKLFLFGGGLPSIYSTTDGINWVVEVSSPPSEISTRKGIVIAYEGVKTLQISGEAGKSLSNGNLLISTGVVWYVNSSAASTSSGNFTLKGGTIDWINNLQANSTSSGNISIFAGDVKVIQKMDAYSTSLMNFVIGYGNISSYVLKGQVLIGTIPVKGATLIAIKENDTKFVYTTQSDDNGNYNLICNMPGEYTLQCFYKDISGNLYTTELKPFITIGN